MFPVLPGTTARFVESVAVYPDRGGSMEAIGVVCDNRLEIDGSLTFATGDGAFDETFASVLLATADAVRVYEELELDGLTGSFDITPFVDTTDYDALSAWLDVRFADGASSGVIEGQASGEDDCSGSDDCSAWATAVPVAAWPIAEE